MTIDRSPSLNYRDGFRDGFRAGLMAGRKERRIADNPYLNGEEREKLIREAFGEVRELVQ